MKMEIITIWLAILVMGIAPLAKADVDSNSIIQDGVEYYIQTDKSVYDLGESVNILYKVSNLTDVGINIGMVSGDDLAFYDFRVTENENLIWRYPYISGATGFITYHLDPYETKEFQTNWNLMNDNGTRNWPSDDFFVNLGKYNVIGEVALFQLDQRIPVSVSIDVIPEPSSLFLMAGGVMGLFLRNKKSKRS